MSECSTNTEDYVTCTDNSRRVAGIKPASASSSSTTQVPGSNPIFLNEIWVFDVYLEKNVFDVVDVKSFKTVKRKAKRCSMLHSSTTHTIHCLITHFHR